MDISAFIKEIKEDSKDLNPETFCIAFFTTSGFRGSNKNLRKLYKNVEEFEKKFEEDSKNVDTMFGIYVGIYEFD